MAFDLSSLFSSLGGDASSLLSELVGGFSGSGQLNAGSGTGLGSLLSGFTGSTNPLYDIMALLSFINEAQLTQEQSGFMKNVLNQQSSALNTAMNPNKLSATVKALTGPLDQNLVTSTLNPVSAQLSASGQNESAPTRQFVSQQALAPYELQEQNMGQNLAEFGLGLPNATPYGLPNFSVGSPPIDWASLLSSGGSTGALDFPTAGLPNWFPGMSGNPSQTNWWNALTSGNP